MHLLTSNDKKRIFVYSMAFSFLFGIIGHAYGLLNNIFSFDSLNELITSNTIEKMKISLGRFLSTLYRYFLRGSISLPWMIGTIAFFFLGLTVYLICRILHFKSPLLIALTAGILVTNITLSALIATFVHDFDVDMISLFFSVLAVFLWKEHQWGFLAAIFSVAFSLGFYQAYICVTACLMIIVCLLDLLKNQPIQKVLLQGVKGIFAIILGCFLYYAIMLLACKATHVAVSNRDGLELHTLLPRFFNSVFFKTGKVYSTWAIKMVNCIPVYADITQIILCLAFAIIMGIHMLCEIQKIGWVRGLLAIILIGVYPLAANALYMIGQVYVYELGIYSFHCIYLLIFALVFLHDFSFTGLKKKWMQGLTIALTVVMLFGNIRTSNALYMKKNLEFQSALSIMTRVVDRIEQYPEYKRNETQVAIFGTYPQRTIKGFEDLIHVEGVGFSATITTDIPLYYFNQYQAFFNYILNCNIVCCDVNTWNQLLISEELSNMPAYPDPDCLKMINGILTVKLG